MYNKLLITGSTGFVGVNLIPYLSKKYCIFEYSFKGKIPSNDIDVFIHLAGKAHDTNNVTNFEEYYSVNTNLTKKLFDIFLLSNAKIFIFVSSIKAVSDESTFALTEDVAPNPKTYYGISKKLAEDYILGQIPIDKKVYILRPCMIHGIGNKGNLSLLYNFLKKKMPYPLGKFKNKRSLLYIENFCFIVSELISQEAVIPSGIYHLSDNNSVSTTRIVELIGESLGSKKIVLGISPQIITFFFKLSDFCFRTKLFDKLRKLTTTFLVSNEKLKKAISKDLPVDIEEGLKRTFKTLK